MSLLNKSSDSKLVTKTCSSANDQSNPNYSLVSEIIYNTEVLKSNLCDYHNAYILVRGKITVIGHDVVPVAFKHCAPITKCITNIDGTIIDDIEDLNLAMQRYNLSEYSLNYSDTTKTLWNPRSLNYKAKSLENTEADEVNEILRNKTTAVPLKSK